MALLAALAFVHFREKPPDDRPVFSTISFPADAVPGFLAFSPHGGNLIVSLSKEGKQQLYLRTLDSRQLPPLANTEKEGCEPRSGRRIAD